MIECSFACVSLGIAIALCVVSFAAGASVMAMFEISLDVISKWIDGHDSKDGGRR